MIILGLLLSIALGLGLFIWHRRRQGYKTSVLGRLCPCSSKEPADASCLPNADTDATNASHRASRSAYSQNYDGETSNTRVASLAEATRGPDGQPMLDTDRV